MVNFQSYNCYKNLMLDLLKKGIHFKVVRLYLFSKNLAKQNTKKMYWFKTYFLCSTVRHQKIPLQQESGTAYMQKGKNRFIKNSKLVTKNTIVGSTPKTREVLSGGFTRRKKDCNKRMFLNFERFNQFISYIPLEWYQLPIWLA